MSTLTATVTSGELDQNQLFTHSAIFFRMMTARYMFLVAVTNDKTAHNLSWAPRLMAKAQSFEFASENARRLLQIGCPLTMNATISKVGRTSFEFGVVAFLESKNGDTLVGQGCVTMVCVSPSEPAAIPIPDLFRSLLLQHCTPIPGTSFLTVPKDVPPAFSPDHVLTLFPRKSDEDQNKHINNVRYVEYLEHARLSLGLPASSALAITYIKEATARNQMTINIWNLPELTIAAIQSSDDGTPRLFCTACWTHSKISAKL
eukprot:c33175_g1_i1.p1 GENE.c33175_g1_i1~~c33175_g1_i1.p1  ORF type:complete len:269 (-),score=47.83 c33175_g1_i1:73-852(-)